MFKYNELSDLKNGNLVTPIKKTENGVLCIDENGDEVIYFFTDFDFNKKLEGRNPIIVDDNSEDSEDEKEPIYTIDSDDSEEDSTNSSSDNKNNEWILSDFEKAKILHKFGYRPRRTIREVNIIKKEVN